MHRVMIPSSLMVALKRYGQGKGKQPANHTDEISGIMASFLSTVPLRAYTYTDIFHPTGHHRICADSGKVATATPQLCTITAQKQCRSEYDNDLRNERMNMHVNMT